MDRYVLLVNTNRLRPAVGPSGLDYIADSLRERHLLPRIVDLCFEANPAHALESALREAEYLLVGLTLRNTDDCYLASGEDFLPGVIRLAEVARKQSDAPLVIGGSGYSVFPEAVLRACGAEYGIAGDGEVPLGMLAASVAGDADIASVPGLVWHEGGEVRCNARWLGQVSELPTRERALIDNKRYFDEGGQAGVETKRGCDRSCIYCADPLGKGRRVRARTPQQVADEFGALLVQGIDHFHLSDSEFNVPVDHAVAVCEEMARRGLGKRVHWYTYATPAGFTLNLARAMRSAGCVGVNFGADSGDERMLAALGRDFEVEDLSRTAEACREAGLVFMYDLLLGGPGETRESVARTIELMKRISPDRVGVSLGVRIYQGTRLAAMVRSQGPLPDNPDLRGATEGNEALLAPVFYLSSELGEQAAEYVAELVGGDQRFFFPTPEAGTEAYNYSDNDRLVAAIREGYRGAYWDILRRLADGDQQLPP
jgi:radical SAM superfamily enzyme YgiQ (UPF0313 family)